MTEPMGRIDWKRIAMEAKADNERMRVLLQQWIDGKEPEWETRQALGNTVPEAAPYACVHAECPEPHWCKEEGRCLAHKWP